MDKIKIIGSEKEATWAAIKSVIRMLDPREPFLPWIAALAQLIIWPTLEFRHKRIISNLKQDVQDLKEGVAKEKDRANSWYQLHDELLRILGDKAPKSYKSYVEDFGAKGVFRDIRTLPGIPRIKIEEVE